jgi:hypothetical protein
MTTILHKNPLSDEQVLYQATVDNEFRTAVLDAPTEFGLDHDALQMPDPVEQQDQAALKFWTEAMESVEVYACASTCTEGPFTIICDGTTK